MDEFLSIFPESSRLAFDQNTIVHVEVEFRYDIHFGIRNVSPIDFRSMLADRYPKYVEVMQSVTLPSSDGGSSVEQLRPAHQFSTNDGKMVVRLGELSLTFISKDYVSWEQFRGYWKEIRDVFERCYGQTPTKRVSLKYIDDINRKSLGLESHSWNHLIKPALLGLTATFGTDHLAGSVSQTILSLNHDDEHASIHTAFIPGAGEHRFHLDAEFSRERGSDTSQVLDECDRLKRHAGRFFRWSMEEPLIASLGPRQIPDHRVE